VSFTDPDSMTPAELVAQYVLGLKGSALFLPYQDYAVIDEWLTNSRDVDELLLVLSEVLPNLFDAGSRKKPSLVAVQGFVLKRLDALRMRELEDMTS
jgi:hypothetical protein